MNLKLNRGSMVTGGLPHVWDCAAILDNARVLQHLGESGKNLKLLDGKHVAILRRGGRSRDADLFLGAAEGLGAQVAEIGAELWPSYPSTEIQRMATLLGRLYAAVECHRALQPLLPLIEAAACIPVYDHITSPDHPTAKIAGLLTGAASHDQKRMLVLQAVLIATIA